jgi:beta-glucanase (GH16 family)
LIALLASWLAAGAAQAGQTLVWADEFNGSSIDRSNWTYDLGGGGWGNNELQYYTDRTENSRIITAGQDSCLLIEARQERMRNRDYTSARLKTQGLKSWTYGAIEARIAIPGGKGVWPAFWMLGANFTDVGWPNCGEIDILEHVEVGDMLPTTVRGSLHGPGFSGANSLHGDIQVANLTGHFHTFRVEWRPTGIQWFVDGQNYFSRTRAQVPTWVFDHPFFIIMNVAIGGNWPGSPDATTEFPAQMLVDYVRVYRLDEMTPPTGTTELKPTIALSKAANGPNWQAIARVTVTANGAPVAGVNVTGAWSGLINVGVNQASTDSAGVAVLSSGRVRTTGTIRFCVTDLK